MGGQSLKIGLGQPFLRSSGEFATGPPWHSAPRRPHQKPAQTRLPRLRLAGVETAPKRVPAVNTLNLGRAASCARSYCCPSPLFSRR
jgi:hypothetical protein